MIYLTPYMYLVGAYFGSDRVLDESSVLPKSTVYLTLPYLTLHRQVALTSLAKVALSYLQMSCLPHLELSILQAPLHHSSAYLHLTLYCIAPFSRSFKLG